MGKKQNGKKKRGKKQNLFRIDAWVDLSKYARWMIDTFFKDNDDLVCQKPLDRSTAGNVKETST